MLGLVALVLSEGCVTSEKCAARYPCPELVARETVTRIKDTVIVTKTLSFDTLVRFGSRDTVFFRDFKTQIETQIVRMPGDTFFVKTKCPPDTIRVEKIIQTTTANTQEIEKKANWQPLLWGVLAVVALFGLGYLFNSIKAKKT